MEKFITKIEINENKFIQKLDIPLSDEDRKHLIFTGKNGSGKTTTLKEINNLMNKLINNGFSTLSQNIKNIKNFNFNINSSKKNIEKFEKQIDLLEKDKSSLSDEKKIQQIENSIKSYQSNILNEKNKIKDYEKRIVSYQKQVDDFSKVNLIFSDESEIYTDIVERKFILAYFEAKRENTPIVSDSIKNIKLDTRNTTDTKKLHKQFIEYMVKKRTDMLNDKFDGDGKKAEEIQKWFKNFENTLKNLFNEPSLMLKYYSEELNFKIEYKNKSFGLNELSDGYSSLLAIVTELILRMEAHSVKAYDMQGIVLIDEIETHLHVELQKKILPFLVDFFPKIQFIVTTHSPFVLSSLSNAVICDLEKNFVTEDLSAYSYDALVESYFDSDKYSQEIKNKLKQFEILSKKDILTKQEEDEYREYKQYFKNLPKFMADELAVKINEILLNDLK